MSQRMRVIENDIKRLTASLSEMSTVNTNSIVRSYSDIVRAPSVSRGPLPESRPRVSVAHPSPKPNTILVMGDSNTRYVNLGRARVSQEGLVSLRRGSCLSGGARVSQEGLVSLRRGSCLSGGARVSQEGLVSLRRGSCLSGGARVSQEGLVSLRRGSCLSGGARVSQEGLVSLRRGSCLSGQSPHIHHPHKCAG